MIQDESSKSYEWFYQVAKANGVSVDDVMKYMEELASGKIPKKRIRLLVG